MARTFSATKDQFPSVHVRLGDRRKAFAPVLTVEPPRVAGHGRGGLSGKSLISTPMGRSASLTAPAMAASAPRLRFPRRL
jgi:hypothetical protein